jgi:hypothetical protein
MSYLLTNFVLLHFGSGRHLFDESVFCVRNSIMYVGRCIYFRRISANIPHPPGPTSKYSPSWRPPLPRDRKFGLKSQTLPTGQSDKVGSPVSRFFFLLKHHKISISHIYDSCLFLLRPLSHSNHYSF